MAIHATGAFVVGCTTLCLSLAATAADLNGIENHGFYGKHAEGWFWYEPEPEPIEPDPIEEPEAAVVEASPTARPEPEPSGPEPLSSAWLAVNLPKYRQKAIDAPTETNIRAYLYLQRVSMDKAERFATATQRVVNGDALLDEYAQYPQGTAFIQTMQQQATLTQDDLLREMSGQTGLMFFFESNCGYCAMQVSVLKTLERLYGTRIVPVSTDGLPLPGNPFPDFVPDRGVAKQLRIRTTPALVLAHPPNGMQVVAHGLMSVEELKARMLAVAAQRGWISPARYQQTRPSTKHRGDFAEIAVSEEVTASPARLVESIDNATR
ncbi:conjugal transfer protein TraF [Salinisphaera sp. T31B1]|uniref:conjugal transfer protein TraF n=1 Tax=Salinisphaera sp. T31B1 TaxID=727963 RepID=UPI0033406870